jgi:LacI family transcriptional regulator
MRLAQPCAVGHPGSESIRILRMAPSRKEKPRGIKEIAETLGISIGTVDRALHERRGVSPKTREKVLKTAKRLNYTPNIAARNLKLNRHLRIGVYLPRQIASYYDALREGIQKSAAAETSVQIDLKFFDYPRLGEGDLDAMKKSDWLQFDGVILAPGHPSQFQQISAAAAQNQKPLVCVTTDAPRLIKLASIRADSFVSGAVAAELLGSWIHEQADIAIFTGDLEVQDHADKLKGFAGSLAMNAPHLRLIPTVESRDSFELAYASAKKVLEKCPDLRGMYINTANSLPVLKALAESGRLGRIRTITTDLYPELIPYIERGEVSASLYQRPYTQGKLAFEVLAAFLARGVVPHSDTRLAPHIILRSNLPLFADAVESSLSS